MTASSDTKDLANSLRRDVLSMTTAAGSGHPTSCLSCAEIVSVLFFHEMKYDIKNSMNPDNDEFILSKGHAAPILYSALSRANCIKSNLNSLRKLKSPLEGHPMPTSLSWAKTATGSLGQGLSVGIGMALAAKLQKRDFRTYVLLGDSELAEGSCYEALQLASHYNLDNLCAIIDVNRLGQRGETMVGHNLSIYKKRISSFGWNTIEIDGHDTYQIISALKLAKTSKKPFAILAKTFKGKGVSFLEDKEKWHGKVLDKEQLKIALNEIPISKEIKIRISKPKEIDYKPKLSKPNFNNYNEDTATRNSYGDTLASLTNSNSNIIALDAEVSNSTMSEKVKEKTPEQFIETFIAEQNLAGISLGLSTKGFHVYSSTFSAFLSRAHDQIRMAAISNANLTFCGSHSGVSIGEDGASQMGLEDIAIFRSLPNSTIFYPSDATSTKRLTELCLKTKGIKYIRTTRAKTPIIYDDNEKFSIGEFRVIKKSSRDKGVIIGSGITLHESIKAYEILNKNGLNVSVIDLYCIKPLNAKKLISFAKKHGNKIIITEDHRAEGGIGEMLSSELINTNIKLKTLNIKGIPHSGTKDELLKKHNINWEAIVNSSKEFFK